MAKPKAYNSKELTLHLRELAALIEDVDVETGDAYTKGEALGRLLFKKALGWTEQFRDDEGIISSVVHKPEAWAIQLIYDRIEGKTPQSVPESANKLTAKDKVSDLLKSRINAMTDDVELKDQGPPPMPT